MSKHKKIIVSVTNDLYTDQRVHKMCLFMQKQGYDVLLVGRLLSDKTPLKRTYQTKRFRLFFKKGALFYANYNLRLFWFLLFHKADILVSNDLDTLLANTLIHQLKGTPLVYDSHEYFTEVPELIHRPKVQRIWERIEAYCFPKLDKIITVNQSIAQKYEQKYNKKLRVVRNVSPLFEFQNVPTKSELGLPEDKTLLILQGSGINVDRGGEELIEAMRFLPECVLLIVGSGDVLEQLKKRVKELSLEQNVLFFGRQPYEKMMNYTYHADIGLTLDKPSNENYLFSLPNKVFDYIHAGTAIVASNLPEVTNVVTKYNVGKLISSHEPTEIAQTIQTLVQNPELLAELKQNCLTAKLLENWENEVQTIADFYP
ncbi:MAG TPA: glycosyltransferase family 4 protein [Crocinitomicaceae bacterium]|nr:glycosyltransferase family 4 protein [Crocinitomicaceae bacterium]